MVDPGAIRIFVEPGPGGLETAAVGLIGAIIGGVIGAASTEFFNHRARKRSVWERVKQAAFSLLNKLNQIYSDALQFRDGIENVVLRMDEEQAEWRRGAPHTEEDGTEVRRFFYLWLYYPAYVGEFRPVHFTSEELWAANKLGTDNLLNELTAMDRRYNSQVEALQAYARERRDAGAVMSAKMKLIGVEELSASMTARDADVAREMRLISARLDDVIVTISNRCDELAREAFTALQALVQAPKKPLGPKAKLELPDPDGQRVTISTDDVSPSASIESSPSRHDGYLGRQPSSALARAFESRLESR